MPRSQGQCFVTNARMERDLYSISLSLVINNNIVNTLFLLYLCLRCVVDFLKESRLVSHVLMKMDKSTCQEKRQLTGLEDM